MSRVTMKDVASVMGVSVMSVSNAFNRPDQLSPDLRDRILSRATKMGYGGPNAAARQLRAGRTNCYGVVFSESLTYAFSDPFSIAWLAGLSEPLQRAGATIMLLPVANDEGADLSVVSRASIDGVVAVCAAHPAATAANAAGLPFVCTDPIDPAGSWVAIDDFAAAEEISRHIRQFGHRDVMIVAERRSPSQITPDEQGFENYIAGLGESGKRRHYDTWRRLAGLRSGFGDDCRVRVLTAGWNSREAGRLAGQLALDRHDRPTAIACLSDVMALGVLDAMSDRGLVPGRDVTVTGIDDLPESARAGLTTVRQPMQEKGRLAGELILDLKRQPRQIYLPHELVIRASSGPAPLV